VSEGRPSVRLEATSPRAHDGTDDGGLGDGGWAGTDRRTDDGGLGDGGGARTDGGSDDRGFGHRATDDAGATDARRSKWHSGLLMR
jgi:hypothetical protein